VAVTPLPGEAGNAVIAARNAYGGPFGPLDHLGPGSTMKVATGQGHFTYRVIGRRVLSARDPSPFQATTDNRLTLVTAGNFDATGRLVVVAELQGGAKPFPPGRPTALAAADDGLVGQSHHLGGLLFWALVLLSVAAATV
jgi:sortase (surface protein transpeptidase)